MPSSYSSNLALELIASGEQAGTWGTTTNTNLGTLLDQAIAGFASQAITDGADTTITIPNGATGVARNMAIKCTGALTANRNLVVPSNTKLYFIDNATTGGYAVTVKVSGQTGVSVPNGKKMVLVCNGTDVVDAVSYFSSLSATTAALPAVTQLVMSGAPMNGATGANIASAATVNLTTATGNIAHITGTTTITAITLGSGMFRTVIFDGILTLTHSATNNNLPGAANITTAAGDRAIYYSDGTTVYCVVYAPASGLAPLASPTFTGTPTLPTGTIGVTQTAGDSSTKLATTAFVDRLRSLSDSTTTTTAVLADRGSLNLLTASITIPASIFAKDDVISYYNNSAGALSLTQGVGLTMRLAGSTTTGTRTLAARGLATVVFVSATECAVTGAGVS